MPYGRAEIPRGYRAAASCWSSTDSKGNDAPGVRCPGRRGTQRPNEPLEREDSVARRPRSPTETVGSMTGF